MIDEYEYRLMHSRHVRGLFSDLRVMLAIFGGAVLVVLQLVELYYLLTRGSR